MKLRILVPVDFEEPVSWEGVQPMLRQVAKGNEVEITVVTVVPKLGTVIAQAAQAAPFISSAPEEMKEKALALASGRLHQIVDTEEFGEIQYVVRSGSVYSKVLETAEEAKVNLILIMSHIPDLGDYLLGPNAAKIVRHAKCSVLAVRPE
ncbi:MAG: universal stress protein [Rhizobiaceae bacterium]